MKKFLSLMLLIFLTALTGYAGSDSLKNLDTAKFVVDLNQGSAPKLKTRMSLILETINNIEEEGVKTDVVVAVRGPASRFMTVNDKYIAPEDKQIKADILKLAKALTERGVKLEQCAVALRFLHINAQEISPLFEVVKNGYVSLIGYQNKGYAFLPME